MLRILGTDGPHRGRRLLVRLRPRGRRRPDRDHRRATAPPRPSRSTEPRWLYSFEADAAGEAIRAGRQEFAAPGHELGRHARQPARARQVARRRRPRIRHRAPRGPAAHHPQRAARRQAAASIPHKRGAGPRRSPPRVVALGFEDFPDFASASILLDAFFEQGGNVFDTGWVYGGGRTERSSASGCSARGVRDEAVVIGKGAHSPLTYPDVIARQLAESLDRLGTDHVDVYFMHRDNPDVPVGEFVDAMDAEVRAGPHPRAVRRLELDAASASTRRSPMPSATGKTRAAALSNNFSLAEMLDPIWPGCVAASDDAWKAWLTERQVTNFAWSSQGRGFFTDARRPRQARQRRAGPGLVLGAELRPPRPRHRARRRASASARSTSRSPTAGAALPGPPADRPAPPGRARRQPAGARHRAHPRPGPLARIRRRRLTPFLPAASSGRGQGRKPRPKAVHP